MSEHKNFPPSAYISFSELKDGETFTFRYGDREHRFTDHIYMCVDENYVGERIVIDLTVFDPFYIGDSESIDVRRVKCKFIVEFHRLPCVFLRAYWKSGCCQHEQRTGSV